MPELDEDLKDGIDILARYVIRHLGTAISARRLAREVLLGLDRHFTPGERSPGVVGCELAASHLSAARERNHHES